MVPAPAVPELSGAPRWLRTGETAYRRMLELIGSARHSVRLETYIYRADEVGARFRSALEAAAQRGVRVQVLLDAFGANALPPSYWHELKAAGGEVRVFNPFTWGAFVFRDHRKLLLVDDANAVIGGFNIAAEYDGDGVARQWRDLGVELRQPAVIHLLAHSFGEMFTAFDLRNRLLQRLRDPLRRALRCTGRDPVLLSGPRLGPNQFRRRLMQSLRRARRVQIVSGYFLPDFRLRRLLRQVVRRGGRVELLLAGKTDVPLAQTAARALYGSLLKSGVQIREYQPQILHAKLAIVDGSVFVGSANLDPRSFGINYELMVRLDDPATVAAAQEIFAADQRHATAITLAAWRASQTWLTRVRGFLARVLLTKIDPWLARRQRRAFS